VYLKIRKFLIENKVLIFLVDRHGPISVIIGKNAEGNRIGCSTVPHLTGQLDSF
jgi:hypothetical protein